MTYSYNRKKKNKAGKFWTSFLACLIVIILVGGIVVFSVPSLQVKIADGIVDKSEIYQNTCAELSEEKERVNTISTQLSSEISEKNILQERYNAMEAEKDSLLAQVNEDYVVYFVEYTTNNQGIFRFYLKNFTDESPVITLGMYDENDVLTETFDFTLVNFPNPENSPNTVTDDDITELAETYHIKFLDGDVVLSDFVCEDGTALDKAYDVHYEVFKKDTMFDVMNSRIESKETNIETLQNELNDSIATIISLQNQINELMDELDLDNQIIDNLTFDLQNYQFGAGYVNDIRMEYVTRDSGIEMYVYTDATRSSSIGIDQERTYNLDTLVFNNYAWSSKYSLREILSRLSWGYGVRLTYIDYYNIFSPYCSTAVRFTHPVDYIDDMEAELGDIYVDGVLVDYDDFMADNNYNSGFYYGVLFNKTLNDYGQITKITLNYYITTDGSAPTVII